MSTAQAEKVMDKALEITDLYLRNARGKLGVPESPPKATAEPPSSGLPVATTAAAGLPGWAKAAAAGVLGLSTLGAGAGLYSLFSKPAATVIEQKADPSGSLLQSLQDGGFHLPEGK